MSFDAVRKEMGVFWERMDSLKLSMDSGVFVALQLDCP